MSTEPFLISDIRIGRRLRPADAGRIAELARSIDEVGLLAPPVVRVVESMQIDGVDWFHVPVLVAGLHRLEALKRLGRDQVDCIVVVMGSVGTRKTRSCSRSIIVLAGNNDL